MSNWDAEWDADMKVSDLRKRYSLSLGEAQRIVLEQAREQEKTRRMKEKPDFDLKVADAKRFVKQSRASEFKKNYENDWTGFDTANGPDKSVTAIVSRRMDQAVRDMEAELMSGGIGGGMPGGVLGDSLGLINTSRNMLGQPAHSLGQASQQAVTSGDGMANSQSLTYSVLQNAYQPVMDRMQANWVPAGIVSPTQTLSSGTMYMINTISPRLEPLWDTHITGLELETRETPQAPKPKPPEIEILPTEYKRKIALK